MKRSTRRTLTGYAFAAPWLIAMVFLIGYPFAASLYFSTCEYPPLRGPVFIGAGNYQELVHDTVFRDSMLITIIYAVVAIPLGVLLALTLALFLNSRIRGRSIYRVVYYLPHLVPSVAVAILWMWMFNPQFGILNVALSRLWEKVEEALDRKGALDMSTTGAEDVHAQNILEEVFEEASRAALEDGHVGFASEYVNYTQLWERLCAVLGVSV